MSKRFVVKRKRIKSSQGGKEILWETAEEFGGSNEAHKRVGGILEEARMQGARVDRLSLRAYRIIYARSPGLSVYDILEIEDQEPAHDDPRA